MNRTLRRVVRALFPVAHRWPAHRHPGAVWQVDAPGCRMALTFDDGPDARDTPALQIPNNGGAARAAQTAAGTGAAGAGD